jgi:hypothetical protein
MARNGCARYGSGASTIGHGTSAGQRSVSSRRAVGDEGADAADQQQIEQRSNTGSGR